MNSCIRQNEFALQPLEPRILLSAEGMIGAAADLEVMDAMEVGGTAIEETMDEDASGEGSLLTYDPFAQGEDIFGEALPESELNSEDGQIGSSGLEPQEARDTSLSIPAEEGEQEEGASATLGPEEVGMTTQAILPEGESDYPNASADHAESDFTGLDPAVYQYDLTERLLATLTAAHGPPGNANDVQPVAPQVLETVFIGHFAPRQPVLSSDPPSDRSLPFLSRNPSLDFNDPANNRPAAPLGHGIHPNKTLIENSDQTIRGEPCES